jgi:hypothetical protein
VLRHRLQGGELLTHEVLAGEPNAVIDQARSAISAATLGSALAEIPELPDPEPEPLYPWQQRYRGDRIGHAGLMDTL